ncbi:MAG: DMT family transporter [Cyanobacteria bacterium P01_D01_bin.105]
MTTRSSPVKISLLTGVTLIAFAANSLLTRMALGAGVIDAASFVTIRLASGAAVLLAITTLMQQKSPMDIEKRCLTKDAWTAALMLFLYAIAFSFSYLQLAAGTGALILFGTVQVTMILVALKQGEKPSVAEWIGLVLALLGLIYLVSPGLEAPPAVGSVLMVIAGGAWGVYSLLGRGSTQPVVNTMNNFVRAVPFAIGASLVSISQLQLSREGVLLAVLSGAIASGVGYALWYAALRGLSATRAATVQLSVPVLAAVGGVFFLQEALSVRLVLASVMILGGVGLAVMGKQQG